VYTVGVARPGLVPVPVEEHTSGVTTRLEESKIDEETMQQIAELTGGLYFRAEQTSDLHQVYEQIDQLEQSDIEIRISRRYQELAGWFLGAALGLLIIELLLRHTIFRSLP
jgi:Ca-activated chloride channel family protein